MREIVVRVADVIEIDPAKKYVVWLSIQDGYALDDGEREYIKETLKDTFAGLGISHENVTVALLEGLDVKVTVA